MTPSRRNVISVGIYRSSSDRVVLLSVGFTCRSQFFLLSYLEDTNMFKLSSRQQLTDSRYETQNYMSLFRAKKERAQNVRCTIGIDINIKI